jgi:hypothetical protein
VAVWSHSRWKNDRAHFCNSCKEEEVFNKLNKRWHTVHCPRCARVSSPDLKGWICLEEYDELRTIFDNFLFQSVNPFEQT